MSTMTQTPNRAHRRMSEYNAAKAEAAAQAAAEAAAQAAAEAAAQAAAEQAAAEQAAAEQAAQAAERARRLTEIARAEAQAIHAAEKTYAIENYRRSDGTLVRQHIKGGVPVVHRVYGAGFVRVEQLLDPACFFINFYPTTTRGKKIGQLFPAGRNVLSIDRSHRNFALYSREIYLATQTVQDLRLSWAN